MSFPSRARVNQTEFRVPAGIGLSIARTLYSHGARVVIVGGQQEHIDGARSYIQTGDLGFAPASYSSGFGSQQDNSADGAEQSGEIETHLCELKDLKAVSELGKKIARHEDRLDGLLLIAGLGVNKFELTKDGYECVLPSLMEKTIRARAEARPRT